MNSAENAPQTVRLPCLSEPSIKFLASPKESRINHCVTYMEQNLHLPLQVESLSAMINVSSSHFFYLFKQATGHSPIDCLIRLRMRKACQLLDTPQFRIKEIAAQLGYKEQYYFSRSFKTVVGLAPAHFRALDPLTRRMLERTI